MSCEPRRREFLGSLAGLALLSQSRGEPIPTSKSGASLTLPVNPPPKPLPSGALRRLGTLRMRVNGTVHGFKFSPSGQSMVVADRDSIHVFNPHTGEPKFRLKYPEGDLNEGVATDETITLHLKRENPRVNNECYLETYHFGTGKKLSEVRLTTSNTNNLALNADASLMTERVSGQVRCYDGLTGKELWHLANSVELAEFSPDKKLLLLLNPSDIQVLDARTGKVLQKLLPPSGGKASGTPVVSPDGQYCAAIADRNQDSACVWNLKTGKLLHTLRTEGKPLGFTPDSQELWTSSPVGAIRWNVTSGKKVQSHDLGSPSNVMVSPDGKLLVAHASNAIWFFDARTGQLLPYSADPPGAPSSLHFLNETTLQGQLTQFGGWVRWDVQSGSRELLQMPSTGPLVPMGLSDDGQTALYKDDKKSQLSVRNVRSGAVVRELQKIDDADSNMVSSPNGQWLLVPVLGHLELVNSQTDQRHRLRTVDGAGEFQATGVQNDTLKISANGRWAAAISTSESNRHTLLILDLHKKQVLRQHLLPLKPDHLVLANRAPRAAIITNRYSEGVPENMRALTIVYDAYQSGELARIGRQNEDSRSVLAFSDCGRNLARSVDEGVFLYEATTGLLRQKLLAGFDGEAMAFSPSGRTLAVYGNTGPVLLWDVLGNRTTTWPTPQPADIQQAWANLLLKEPDPLFNAVKLLARFPEQALPFLKKQFATVPQEKEARIKEWIDQLGHGSFTLREKAQRELAKVVSQATPLLERAQITHEKQEVRRRVGLLLQTQSVLSPEHLRILRVVEAVEWMGTAEAKQQLHEWATGGYARPLSSEAEASLDRLRG